MFKYHLPYNFIKSKEKQKNIVILLHGYGSNKEDLTQLVPLLNKNLPNTSFIIPNAPFPCDNGFGYQWFPLVITENSINLKNYRVVFRAYIILDRFLQKIVKEHNVDYKDITIFGFSQGAILSFLLALGSNNTFGAIIGHSGCFFLKENIFPLNSKQNILAIHGRKDEVVPFSYFEATMDYFDKNKINYEAFTKEDLAHHVDMKSLETTENFIFKHLYK